MKITRPNDEMNALAQIAEDLRSKSHDRTRWPEPFKARVKALMDSGLSVSEAARLTGIDRSLIDRWRRGKTLVTKPVFMEMALVDQRHTDFPQMADEGEIALRTPRGFSATLSVAQLVALAQAGVL